MNGEMNLFNPLNLEMSRTTFGFSPRRSGTCNVGRLIPAFCFEIMPGDEINMNKVNSLFKMSTPKYPTMDALYADVYFFYVPNRLVLSRRYGTPNINDSNQSWAAFVGAQDNNVNMPIPQNGIELPYLDWSSGDTTKPGSLMDYFLGEFQARSGQLIQALPLLGYFAIWNEDFREPSTMTPVTWNYGSSGRIEPQGIVPLYATVSELADVRGATVTTYTLCNALASSASPTGNAQEDPQFWLPFPVCRFHGYFGSALPWPQRNSAGVLLPLGDKAVVKTAASPLLTYSSTQNNLLWSISTNVSPGLQALLGIDVTSPGVAATFSKSDTGLGASTAVPSNLYADLSTATAANVNALRAAIQKQRWYEKLARSGNRYDELEYGLFGVRPHDSGDDRPIYLGGQRIPLSIEMVASTNGGTTSGSAAGAGSLGSLGAFSHTNFSGPGFHHAFDDWGFLHMVFCIRHHDTFSSGLEMFWKFRTREDLYFPTFAHLGEMAITEDLLCFDGRDNVVFGYQEAWAHERYSPDRVCGLIAPSRNLGYMTYAKNYAQGTTLAQFLNASAQVETVDQTLLVSSNTSGFQFVYQFDLEFTARRCLPRYSDPGLMDHF